MSSIVVLLALSEQAFAIDIHVPSDAPTLAQALVTARATDTIVLDTDITENIVLNNINRTIEGAVGTNSLTGSITVTNGGNLTISNLTLLGGQIQTDLAAVSAGFFCVSRSSGVTVVNSTVNLDGVVLSCFEPAVSASNSTLTVVGSDFRFNAALGATGGGAIDAVDTNLDVASSEFSLNVGYPGGAIAVAEQALPGGSVVHIQTSDFVNNSSAGGAGGAVYAQVGNLELWANQFNNNYNLVYFTPGISLADAIALGIDVSANLVGLGDGGGVYIGQESGAVDVWNNTFCGNIADRGAGLFVEDVPDAAIYNNRFAENWSAHYGGGMYVEADGEFTDPVRVVNNTFLYNTAGRLPPPAEEVIVAIGGGGSAAFVNTVADFRNNIVGLTLFGAGLMGVAQDLGVTIEGGDAPDYTIGDLLTIDFNDFWHNCDVTGCGPEEGVDFSGDLSQISLPASNIALEPFPVYFQGGEFNCFPDAFYPEWDSPVVRSGDPDEGNRYDANFSDMGSYGGPRADVLDRDADGYENIYDCNDEPGGGGVHPDAPEVCDGFDNDCDGQIDEGFDTNWYPDGDGDGYGDENEVQPLFDCSPPADHVLNRDDCDDTDDTVSPGSAELCDGLDNDCDDVADGGLPFLALYQDRDGDNYGAGAQVNGCLAQDENAGAGSYYLLNGDGTLTLRVGGYVENDDDCNDFEPNVSPGAPDTCDDLDNDCDGIVDNGEDGDRWVPDADEDGFGSNDDELAVYSCSSPGPTYVLAPATDNQLDCDDTLEAVNPGADEVCDQVDNDCDGQTDKDAADAPVLFEDLDGDKLGNPARVSTDCVPPQGYTATQGTDCDDGDPNILECPEACGCQSTPSGGSLGLFGSALAMAIVGLRRRRA
jgi:hypothetical protein